MRFTCPSCNKAYRLPPERLGPQGKAQIACPNCKAVVAVAAGTGDDLVCTLIKAADGKAADAGAVSAQADAGAAGAGAGWFVVLGKDRQGPFSKEQIAELGAAGKLTQASMAWQKGLPAWTKIAEIADLAGLVPAARSSQLIAAAPVQPADTAHPEAAPVVDAGQSEPAAKTEPDAKTPEVKATEPTPAQAKPAEVKAAAAKTVEPKPAETKKPEPKKPEPEAKKAESMWPEAKKEPEGPQHHDMFFSSHQEIQLPDPHAHKPTKEEYQSLIQEFSVMFRLDKRGKRQKVLIGVVLGSLVVAAIAFGVVLKIGADRKRQLLQDSKQMLAAFSLSFSTTVNVDVANEGADPSAPETAKKPEQRKDVSAFSQEIVKKMRKKRAPVAKAAGTTGGAGNTGGSKTVDAAKTAAADAAWIKQQQEEAKLRLAGPGGKTENLGIGVAGAGSFDFKAELKSVCRNRQGDMRACGKQAGQESGFRVTLTFNELGKVGSAKVSGGDASIGTCIASKLRGVNIGAQASGKSGECAVD